MSKTGFYKGRLGIGLTSTMGMGDGNPRYPLDINGDIRLTGAIVNSEGLALNMVNPDSAWVVDAANNKISYSDGNVGIGTTSPQAPLHIVDKAPIASASEVLRLQRGDSTHNDITTASKGSIGMYLEDSNNGGGEVAKIEWRHDGTNHSAEGHGTLSFWTSNTGGVDGVPEERMTIRASGNVGIGTTEPNQLLTIKASSGTNYEGICLLTNSGYRRMNLASPGSGGNGNCYFNMWGSDNTTLASASGEPSPIVQIHCGGNSWFNGGNVGIGTTSPGSKLQTRITSSNEYSNGNVNVSDSIFSIYNNPSSEVSNSHATMQFAVYGGTHNRVGGISLVSQSDSTRKADFAFWTDDASQRTEKIRKYSFSN